jgi:hypothetical protein
LSACWVERALAKPAAYAMFVLLVLVGVAVGGCSEISEAAAPAVRARTRQPGKLVFDDEFNGTRLDAARWSPYDGPVTKIMGCAGPRRSRSMATGISW